EHQTLDIEVSRQSDANFLREYYEKEFREEKPQETYVSYRNVVDNQAFTALASWRLNDFDTQALYAPQLVARETGEPLLGGFMTARAYADNAKLEQAEGNGLPSQENIRTGVAAQEDWPFDLPNGDRVQASVGGNADWFDETVDDGHAMRWAGSAGVAWSRSFH